MKIKLNPAIEGMSGQLGDLVFREMRGKTVVSRKATMTTEPTEGQLAHRERFKKAVAYGRSALADMEVRVMYEEAAKRRDVPVFSVAIADYFHAPTINSVDVMGYHGEIGNAINIHATDDFGVKKVYVTIKDTQGHSIESGEAVQSAPDSDLWIYTATKQGQPLAKFQFVAVDRPGGTAVMNMEKTF
jgi:hypothetical protein